jgi:hypothetical protein
MWGTAAILILVGGVIFWVGAFIPPWKQWMTSDIREYLSIIAANRTNWYIIHACILIGTVISVFGFQLLSRSFLISDEAAISPVLGGASLLAGAFFFMMNVAFRLTVTLWATQLSSEEKASFEIFKALLNWSNLIFAFYMILTYAGIGFFGLALRDSILLPRWICWFWIVFGFAGVVGYPAGIPVFAPPLMLHFPVILTGGVMLFKLRS